MSSKDRCGYRLEVGLADDELGGDPCDRPVWEDHDRCVWHAKVDDKSSDLFEDDPPEAGEVLDGAYLRGASLVGVDWFAGTSMVGADLSGADVSGADLSGVDLTLATLSDLIGIETDFESACLEGATFTNADLRRATLEGAYLDEAVLTDVHIDNGTSFGETTVYERGLDRPSLDGKHPLEAAAWVYRQLRQLYQENALPTLTQRSYVKEKDARRRLAWDRGDYATAIKWELSRWVMLYGSSPYRVLGVSFLVIVVSALLYPLTGGIQEVQGNQLITYTIEDPEAASGLWIVRVFLKSLYFSVVTFATLGYGDIQPLGTSARALAGVETLLGSLLSALLVFVLARIVTW